MQVFSYFLYQILSLISLVLIVPFLFFKKTKSFTIRSIIKRIFPDPPVYKNKTILLHASSVGELNSIKKIVELLKQKYPQNEIIITTFTETALELAKKITNNSFLIPFDIKYSVKRFLKNINPSLVFISETEIWPVFIRESSKISKVYYINARISDRSFKYYRLIAPLIKYTLKHVEKIFVQDEKSYKNFLKFINRDKLVIAGNTKYDNHNPEINYNYDEVIKKLNFNNKIIITFGSIHVEEFEIILKSYLLLKREFDEIRYIIVPRHIEKLEEFKKAITGFKINYAIFSDVMDRKDPFKDLYDSEILLVDKMGILIYFYSISTISFVGGTLNKTGGHNLLEPAIFSRPVLFGPNYINQKESGDLLIKNGGGFITSDEYDIYARIKVLISNKDKLKEAGYNSNKTLLSLSRVSEKIINMI